MLKAIVQLTIDGDGNPNRFIVTLKSKQHIDGYVGYSALRRFESIPERTENKQAHGSYDCGATTNTVAALLEWEKDGIELEFGCEDTATKFNYLKLWLLLSATTQSNYAAYKANATIPEHNLKITDKHVPGRHQVFAAIQSSLNEGFGYFMEQGTGKTFAAIIDACNIPSNPDGTPLRVLVVCPNNVRVNWVREWNEFSTLKHKATVIRGGQVARINQLIQAITPEGQEISVVIVSYDTLIQSWEAIGMIPWDVTYLDEAHYIKSPRTKRWEFCKKLRDVSKRRRVLTGTPIANSLFDTYTLFEFMGEGFSGFTSFKAFREYYGVWDESRERGFAALVGLQNIPHMKDLLSRLTFSITKREALPDLPEKVYDIIEVDLQDEQLDAYMQLAETLSYEIESDLAESENLSLTINNVLTKLLKLAQITSGFLNVPPEVTDEGEIIKPGYTINFSPNPKIEAIVNLIEEKTPDQKTIIWCCWVPDIEKIARALALNGQDVVTYYGGTSEADRQTAEDRFNNDPNCRWFVGNPAAGGTGLNLLGYNPRLPTEEQTTNCDHVIYFSQDWSSLKRSQSEDRAHRRGTRQNVRVTDLCVPNSIDETIRTRVIAKRKHAMEITDIREILSSVLDNIRSLGGN